MVIRSSHYSAMELLGGGMPTVYMGVTLLTLELNLANKEILPV